MPQWPDSPTVASEDAASPVGQSARFPPFSRETLYAGVARHVRELIETERLRPGERLPTERELARLLGVSRVPIREAMRTLSAQGLVEIRRGQGTFVAPRALEATIDQLAGSLLRQLDAYTELFAVRRLLEPAAAQWAAARAEPEDVDRLERLVTEMDAAGVQEPPDFEVVGDRDAQFHLVIAGCAENRVLLRIMQAIQDLHREQLETSQRYDGRVSEAVRDHRRIVEAIRAGDPVSAHAAMLRHLESSERATQSRIEQLGGVDGGQSDLRDRR